MRWTNSTRRARKPAPRAAQRSPLPAPRSRASGSTSMPCGLLRPLQQGLRRARRRMGSLSCVLIWPLLAACQGPLPVPQTVKVPVPIRCLDRAPERPALASDADLSALDDRALVIGLALDRRQRQAYELTLEAAVAGCVQGP